MPNQHQTAAFLLAGGKSSRMGQNKALLQLNNETLAERALRKLRAVSETVAIAGASPELAPYARIIPDTRPDQGPLGGIVSALEQTQHEWNLFLPVDVPYLPESALRALISVPGSLCIMAQTPTHTHPLCAVFSRAALPILRDQLDSGQRKVRAAAEATGSYIYLQFQEESWFANLNTPEEFAEAERLSLVKGTASAVPPVPGDER